MASPPTVNSAPPSNRGFTCDPRCGVDCGAGLFEAAFCASPDSIMINRLGDGLVVAVNEAFLTLSGFTPEEIVGKFLKELDFWVVAEERRAFVKQLEEKGAVHSLLARFRLRDGRERVLQISARPLEVDGQACVVSVTRDVADLLRIQNELHHKLDELDSVFRAAPTGIGVVVSRVIVQANDRLCQMTGYSREELVGNNARLFYPSEEEYLWVGEEKYAQIGRLGTGTVETRWQRRDGRIIDVLLSSTPIDLADLSAGVTFTALDITARKQAERESQERKAYLTALHKTALNMLDRLDIEELLQTIVNQAAALAGTRNGFISLIDEASQKLVIKAGCGRYGEADIVGFKLGPDEGMAGQVWQTGKPMLIDDYRTWPGRLTAASFKDLRATMCVPIRRRQKLVGVIGIGHFEGDRRFGPLESEVLEHFADLAALGMDNAELYSRLQSELKAKAAAEARYRSVFENTGVGTVLSEADTILSMVNAGFAEMVGYPREAIEGRMQWTSFIAPEDHARMLAIHHLRRRDPAQAPKQFECALMDREGRRKAVVLNVDLIPGTTTSVGSFIDISRLKATEGALRRYEQVVISSSDYLGLVDRDYVFQAVNPAYAHMVGKPVAQIVGCSLTQVFGLAVFNRHQKPKVDKALGGQELHLKAWYDTPALGRRYIDTTYYPCREADGTIAGVVIVGRDITDLRRMETQLLQAQKMEAIGTLAGGIAHDFNNLLMGIQGRTSLMLSDADEDHPFLEHLQSIESHVHSAVNLTRQLLGFARGGKYEVRPTDLNELIKAHNRMFSRTRKEISVQGKYARDLWAVAVDQGQINQVLLNLYVNAWQAMPAGGTIYVETRNIALAAAEAHGAQLEPGRYVKVSVTDTGVGMDQATCQRVFEPFFTTREMGHGTGLGLASAYGILQNHDGAIHVYSEKGHGATFSFYLPATDALPEAEIRSVAQPAPGEGTILLVDDEPLILDVAAAMITRLGYTVLRAGSGAEAVDIFNREQARIDAVVLDMIMPGMGGSETFDRLKAIDPAVRVLLSSGYSLNGKASEIIDRGCTGFIQKPFNLGELSEKLKIVLKADATR